MTPAASPRLLEAVQTNCHIADARAATDLTLCIYLLQMRELYRWEQGRAALQPLPHKAIAGGPAGRAVLWASLEQRDDVPLLLDAGDIDRFVCAAPAVLSAVG